MHSGKRILGIIPARSGSKGLHRKNILLLNGKPLIAWTIEQARASSYLDKVIVSTDDEEIASIAKVCGADVPFIRPKELATDGAKTFDVITHALNWFEKNLDAFDLFVLLQPTSPLRTSGDIDGAIKLLFAKKYQAVISVCETEHHPYWSNILPAGNSMDNFLRPELVNKNRQELPTFYRINGAVYAAFCDYVKAQQGFFGKGTYAYIMPKERSIDIDTVMDFKFAEFMLQRNSS